LACHPAHTDRFRLALILKGTGILPLEGRRIALMAPALLCLNETEQPEWEDRHGLEARVLFFHPAVINQKFDFTNIRGDGSAFSGTEEQDLFFLRPFLQCRSRHGLPVAIGPNSAGRIVGLMENIRVGLEEQPDDVWPCRTRSYFLELLFLTQRLFEDPEATEWAELSGPTIPEVGQILIYLHTHYMERITLDELCRVFHTNRTTLSRQFREATDLTVMDYLIRLRLRVASTMLRNTELPISEVMTRVGFMDNTHFTRSFKRHLGHSPSEYRQQFCWMLH
jgi:AraC family L-rhamnose operon regulatory protein RhaS